MDKVIDYYVYFIFIWKNLALSEYIYKVTGCLFSCLHAFTLGKYVVAGQFTITDICLNIRIS